VLTIDEVIVTFCAAIRKAKRFLRNATLLDLRRRGLAMGPELAVADGALGFWQAAEEVWPQTRSQRCWVHKTAHTEQGRRVPRAFVAICR
jgi:transposase-like protein